MFAWSVAEAPRSAPAKVRAFTKANVWRSAAALEMRQASRPLAQLGKSHQRYSAWSKGQGCSVAHLGVGIGSPVAGGLGRLVPRYMHDHGRISYFSGSQVGAGVGRALSPSASLKPVRRGLAGCQRQHSSKRCAHRSALGENSIRYMPVLSLIRHGFGQRLWHCQKTSWKGGVVWLGIEILSGRIPASD